MIELVQGETGVHPLPVELVREIRAACDEHGALLIVDEVQTGMGRTGTLWAYERYGIRPDVMTLAKGLGGGLPIGALVTAPEYADVFAPGDHGSTFAGNPLVTAAANAALDVIDDPAFLEAVRERGTLLMEGVRELPGVSDVRGAGLMVAAELSTDAPALVRRALFEQRLVLNATGPRTLRFLPPLVVSEAEIADALGRLRDAAPLAVDPVDADRAPAQGVLAERAHPEPLGDAHRRQVLGRDDRDQLVRAERAPGPLHRRAGRLGRIAAPPGVAGQEPADLEPRPALGVPEPDAPDERAVVSVLDRPQPVAAQAPVAREQGQLPPGPRRVEDAADVAHDLGIGGDPGVGLGVVLPPGAQGQPGGRDRGDVDRAAH